MNETAARVLCVDDEESVLKALRRALGRHFYVATARSGRAGLQMMRYQGPFAVVIADYNMPEMNGVDFLHAAREVAPDTTRTMLTASACLDLAVEAIHQGQVFRFLSKPWSIGTLRSTIQECVKEHERCVLERSLNQLSDEAQSNLIQAARVDALTGVFNRAALDDYHADLHARAAGAGMTYALLLADVDRFKEYNYHYGHAKGDSALHVVAQTIRQGVRDEDFVARYGGEEFAVLCENVKPADLAEIGDRLVRQVFEVGVAHERNLPPGVVTISIGAAICDPQEEASPTAIMGSADAALCQAKNAGRNFFILDSYVPCGS